MPKADSAKSTSPTRRRPNQKRRAGANPPPGRSGDRPWAAIPGKRGSIIVEMAAASGRHHHHPGTVHRWLYGLGRHYHQDRHDRRDPGGPPSGSGLVRGSRNTGMVAGRICGSLGAIPCSRRTAPGIAGRFGFSTCGPRSHTSCDNAGALPAPPRLPRSMHPRASGRGRRLIFRAGPAGPPAQQILSPYASHTR